jgi:uncharacterized repeat protein (TIGR01451 family)
MHMTAGGHRRLRPASLPWRALGAGRRQLLAGWERLGRGLLVILALAGARVWGVNAPSLTFYVPFPEADQLTGLMAVESGGGGDAPASPMTSYISIAAIASGTIIYYDQWEDGYEPSHDYGNLTQATTQVWGDGNTANGYPPGIPSDLIGAGTVILLQSSVPIPRVQSNIMYDARDKIASTRTVSVTRTCWATNSGTLFAGCVETFDTAKWGTEYRCPIGENIPDNTPVNYGDNQMFEYTALSIMAAQDNTTVQIDADNNGTYETTETLDEGETYYVNGGVNVGGHVLADKPVQVIVFSGDKGSNYESRDSSLLPVSTWSSNYYTPVSTADRSGTAALNATRVWLYNPGTSSITVNYQYRVGSGSLSTGSTTVPAGSYNSVQLTASAGYRFYTTGSPAPVFYAYSTTDSDSTDTGDNQAWDWSFTLIPQPLLSPQVLVGLGIGRDPDSDVNPSENGNPVWITPVGNGETAVTVYVDYDGDNLGSLTDPNGFKYDASYSLKELQQAKIYDPDGDQTGMLVYVLSTNVTLAAAWGQDTLTATAGEPGLDVGTSVPPEDVIDVSKDLSVTTDADGDGVLSPSDRAAYTIRIGSAARAAIPADIVVTDVVPADTTYVPGSTRYKTSDAGSWIAVPDDGSGTPFPLDGSGLTISASIPVGGAFTVSFQVDVDAYANLDPGRVSIVNTGTTRAVQYNRTLTFRNEAVLHGSIGDRVWNDLDGDGVQDPGETGINGVVVYLDLDNDGTRDTGEPYSTTSGDGAYLLTGTQLEAGAHVVRVDAATLPPGYLQTYDLDGTGTAHVATVTLAGGQDRTDVDFGYVAGATIGNQVWNDANNDGLNSGETGINGVAVQVFQQGKVPGVDTPYATTTTATVGANAGVYSFSNVLPGNYFIYIPTPPASAPASSTLTVSGDNQTDNDDNGTQSGGSGTAVTGPVIALTGGETDNTVDFGFVGSTDLNKTVDKSTATVTEALTFTITPNYAGPALLTNARVTDVVPTGTTFASFGQSGDVNNVPPLTWTLGSNTAAVDGTGMTTLMVSGSYTGNGTDDRNITGLGFQPVLVLIKADATQNAVARSATFTGDTSKDLGGATAVAANLIQALQADGFQVGNDARVNGNGTTYHYVAFRAMAGQVATGTYTGTGGVLAVTGTGFEPAFLLTMGNQAHASGWKTAEMSEGASGISFETRSAAERDDEIRSLDADGFTLDDTNPDDQNASTDVYNYIAFKTVPGEMATGSFTGNGTDNRNIRLPAGVCLGPRRCRQQSRSRPQGLEHRQQHRRDPEHDQPGELRQRHPGAPVRWVPGRHAQQGQPARAADLLGGLQSRQPGDHHRPGGRQTAGDGPISEQWQQRRQRRGHPDRGIECGADGRRAADPRGEQGAGDGSHGHAGLRTHSGHREHRRRGHRDLHLDLPARRGRGSGQLERESDLLRYPDPRERHLWRGDLAERHPHAAPHLHGHGEQPRRRQPGAQPGHPAPQRRHPRYVAQLGNLPARHTG